MWNFLEHRNLSNRTIRILTTLYDIDGIAQSTFPFNLEPGAQFDVPVHAMTGRSEESYGSVCSPVMDEDPGVMDGAMVYYLQDDSVASHTTAFQFAFAMPLSNGKRGVQFVPFNTFQPSLAPEDSQKSVANWISIYNTEAFSAGGTISFYSTQGEVLDSFYTLLKANERRDFSAHHFGENLAGIVKWLPDDNESLFQLRNVRYIYDNETWDNSFTTAFQLEGQYGSGEWLGASLNTEVPCRAPCAGSRNNTLMGPWN